MTDQEKISPERQEKTNVSQVLLALALLMGREAAREWLGTSAPTDASTAKPTMLEDCNEIDP